MGTNELSKWWRGWVGGHNWYVGGRIFGPVQRKFATPPARLSNIPHWTFTQWRTFLWSLETRMYTLEKTKAKHTPFYVFCIVLMMLYFSGILCKSRAVLCFILNVTKSHSQFPKSHHQLQHNSWCWMCQYNSRHSKVCVCSSHILSDSTYTWWQYSDLSIYIFKYLLCYYITLAFYFALCHLFYLSHFMSF